MKLWWLDLVHRKSKSDRFGSSSWSRGNSFTACKYRYTSFTRFGSGFANFYFNGSLESSSSINIRGTGTIGQGSSGSPLILIDGMEGDINTLNPQDIENISVLKDAAASSIYGSRAPFGVILITTKMGVRGKHLSVIVIVSVGIRQC